ncbi:MAG: hypothetical protein ACO3LB_08270 [Flavobacteriaceae bacterium]
MNRIYCTGCGHKIEYAYSKPKFCSNCGLSLDTTQKSRENFQKNVDDAFLAEDETDAEEVPTLYNGLAVDTESYGNNVFSFESLIGEEDKSKAVRSKRSRNLDDFINDRKG